MLNVLHWANCFVAISKALSLSDQLLGLKNHIASPPRSYFSKLSEQYYLFKFVFNKTLHILGTDPMCIIKKFRNIPT